MITLDMFRGDDREFTLTLTEDGLPMNLTGATLRFTAKRSINDPDTAAVITKTVGSGITIDADPTSGIVVVALLAADTADVTRQTVLVWDVQVVRGGKTRTVVAGTLDVLLDVSVTAP